MFSFKRASVAGLVAAVAMAFAASAQATSFDASLIDPPGVYFGTGNVNAHFTTNVDGNVELGLGTVQRYITALTPNAGTNVYNVNTGTTSAPGRTGSDWGFVFSINTNANGNGSLTLAAITASICIQDVGQGVSSCFDPLAIPDNSHASSSPTTTAQNAEALQFNGLGTRIFLPNYDINANDTYIFTLSAFDANRSLLNSVQSVVVAGTGAASGVPEPLTLSLLGMGLVGLAGMRRKRSA